VTDHGKRLNSLPAVNGKAVFPNTFIFNTFQLKEAELSSFPLFPKMKANPLNG
jgi:hypothetical protein